MNRSWKFQIFRDHPQSASWLIIFLLLAFPTACGRKSEKNGAETKDKYSFYRNGIDYTVILDDGLNGHIYSYYKGGRIKTKAAIRIKEKPARAAISYAERHGPCQAWHEEGAIKETGQFKNGHPDGIWKVYYPSGKMKKERIYADGKLNGITREWYENGTLKTEISYKDNKEDGLETNYMRDGFKYYEVQHLNAQNRTIHTTIHRDEGSKRIEEYRGKEMTREASFDKEGKVEFDFNYQNGKKHGVNICFVDGNRYEAVYDHGLLNGRKTTFYPDGQKESEADYRQNLLTGVRREWHPNGKLLREQQYQNGKLNGTWLEWYGNGDPKFKKTSLDDRVETVEHYDPVHITVHTVSTTRQLLDALGDFRRIILKKGIYDLSAPSDPAKDTDRIGRLDLKNVTALILEGEKAGEVSIVVSDPRAIVITISSGYGVTLKNLRVGHQVAASAECESGVLMMRGCRRMAIENCTLFGSGTHGLDLTWVEDLTVRNSEITDCSYRLLAMVGCKRIRFQDCVFSETGNQWLIWLTDSSAVEFDRCRIHDNWSENTLFQLQSSFDVRVTRSEIKHNLVAKLSNQADGIQFAETRFSNNEFLSAGETADPRIEELLKAITNDQPARALELIQAGVELNSRRTMTPLGAAVSRYDRCDLNLIKALLKAGADPNVRMKTSSDCEDCPIGAQIQSPLHILCLNNPNSFDNSASFAAKHLQAAELLLKSGARVDIRDEERSTPLHYAAVNGFGEMANLLIAHGADVNHKAYPFASEFTPLLRSLVHNKADTGMRLIVNGADVNVTTEDGDTPLHFVAYPYANSYLDPLPLETRLRLTEALLRNGADMNRENHEGVSAYQRAEKAGEQKMLELLGKYRSGKTVPMK